MAALQPKFRGGQGGIVGSFLRHPPADAGGWAKALDIELRRYDIAPLVAAFQKTLKIRKDERTALGNVKARVRMILLYAIANTERRIVMGTGTKSEIASGDFTPFGEGGG